MRKRIAGQDGNGILYEDLLVGHAEPALFEAATWNGAPVAPGGRGTTRFIPGGSGQWVLRHYHRGGLIGRLIDDRYLWLGADHTRCFREWLLLEQLAGLGLPVPRPVAARYRRQGLYYTADLITVRIDGVEPLSALLARGPVEPEVWAAVGRCIAAFHRAGVCHADLNAHNVQVGEANGIFLLDFDRGRIRRGRGGWRQSNLARLHRSLIKISRSRGGRVGFSEREWRWLRDGYEALPLGSGGT